MISTPSWSTSSQAASWSAIQTSAHDYPNNFVQQAYLPQDIEGTVFYQPGGNPKEEQFKRFLNERWGDQYSY